MAFEISAKEMIQAMNNNSDPIYIYIRIYIYKYVYQDVSFCTLVTSTVGLKIFSHESCEPKKAVPAYVISKCHPKVALITSGNVNPRRWTILNDQKWVVYRSYPYFVGGLGLTTPTVVFLSHIIYIYIVSSSLPTKPWISSSYFHKMKDMRFPNQDLVHDFFFPIFFMDFAHEKFNHARLGWFQHRPPRWSQCAQRHWAADISHPTWRLRAWNTLW